MMNINKSVDNFNEIDKTQIIKEIKQLKKSKNAIILAHFYVDGDIQDVADFVGDSLALAFQAQKTDADIIMFAGVHFMAETAKILSPDKKVLMPDLQAGCPLADSLTAMQLLELKKKHPDHFVVSYVNTTAEVKALSDIICTSSNAVDIVNSLPEDVKVIFGPDKNLGYYVKSMSHKKDMIIWDGACPVHLNFSYEKLHDLKKKYPDAIVLAHPECDKKILVKADYIGSTSKIIKWTQELDAQRFIIATEPGVIHQMKKLNPNKEYIPLPRKDGKESICVNMKKHNLEKVYLALKNEQPEVTLDKELIEKAYRPIRRMLDISEQLGLK